MKIDFDDDPGDLWWLCTTCLARIKKADNDAEAWAAAKAHRYGFPAHAITFGFENGWSALLTDAAVNEVEIALPELAEARQ